jgi:hypothetical protein
MQGKDAQAASETCLGTWFLLLRINFSADHTMDIKTNFF